MLICNYSCGLFVCTCCNSQHHIMRKQTPSQRLLLHQEEGSHYNDRTVDAANAEADRIAAALGIASQPPRPLYVSQRSLPLEGASPRRPTPRLHLAPSDESPSDIASDITSLHSSVSPPRGEPHLYDEHGQRAPYYEGPYFVKHLHGGRRVKRRWCKFGCEW